VEPKSVSLYGVGEQGRVLVTGKPGVTMLPPPFNQVPSIAFHEIHHKFVVCGFNVGLRERAVVGRGPVLHG
jgi:hypothetical protein